MTLSSIRINFVSKGRFLKGRIQALGLCLVIPFLFPHLVCQAETTIPSHHEAHDVHSHNEGHDPHESEYHEHDHQHSPDEAPHSHEHNHSSQTHSDTKITFTSKALDMAELNTKIALPVEQKSFASSGYFLGIFRPPIN